jgi:hypothetical protein
MAQGAAPNPTPSGPPPGVTLTPLPSASASAAAGPPPGVTLTPLPPASSATPPAGSQTQGEPLTANPGNEGTYEMQGPSGDTVKVPYSKVGTVARDQGYKLTGGTTWYGAPSGENARYLKDYAADPRTAAATKEFYNSAQDPVQGAMIGAARGGALTAAGLAHIARKVTGTTGSTTNAEKGLQEFGEGGDTGAEDAGKFIESAGEFMMGDEALKGMSYVDKLKQVLPALKVLEKSPVLAKAVDAAIQQGTVGGAQALAKSGGDVGNAAETGLLTAAVPMALEGAGATVGSAMAAAAPKPSVGDLVSSKLDDLLGTIGGNATKEETGQAVGRVVKNIQQTATQLANEAYNPLKEPLGLPANATRDQIVEAAQNAAKPQPTGILDENGKPIMSQGDGGRALADLRAADTAYGASREDVNRALVQKLAKTNTPELAYRFIQQAGMDDMEAVLDKMDEPTRAMVAHNVLSDVLRSGGEPEDFKASKALKAYRQLDANGEKSGILFGNNAGRIEDTLQSIADLTDSPAKRVEFGRAVRSVAHSLAYGGMVGGTVGHVAGSYEAGAAAGTAAMAATYAPKVMQAVIGNPRIGGFLTSAIRMGARPEVYGPMIAKMVQEYNQGTQQPQPQEENGDAGDSQYPKAGVPVKAISEPQLTYDVGPLQGKPISGLVQRGNIDVNHRPQIKNADGSSSTIFSMTVPIGKNGHSVPWDSSSIAGYALVPSIADGRFLTSDGKKPLENDRAAMQQLEDAATAHYDETRQHLGIFSSPETAEAYTKNSHAWGNDGTARKIYMPSK